MTLLDEYVTRVQRRRRTEETVYNVQRYFARFRQWCDENDIDPDAISAGQMERFFDELGLTDGTRRNYLVNLRAAYKYAHRRGVIKFDPTIDVYIPPKRDELPKIIPGPDLKAMKANCPDRRATLHFSLLAYTGMRRAEVIGLPWEQVNLEARTINVIGKGGKLRAVPIHPALGEVLADNYAPRDVWVFPNRFKKLPVTPANSDRILRTYTAGYSHHDFRRTVATSLDANGVEEHLIEEIMGWAKRGMLAKHYRNVAPERLQQAILRLYADDPL